MKKVVSLLMAIVMIVGIVPLANLTLQANAANPFCTGQYTWHAYERWTRLFSI